MWISRIRFLNSNSCSFPLWWPCRVYTCTSLLTSPCIAPWIICMKAGFLGLHTTLTVKISFAVKITLHAGISREGFFCTLKTITKLSPVCQWVSPRTYILMDCFREQIGLSFKGIKLVWGFVYSRDQVEKSQGSLQCKFICYIWGFDTVSQNIHPRKPTPTPTQADKSLPPKRCYILSPDMWNRWER